MFIVETILYYPQIISLHHLQIKVKTRLEKKESQDYAKVRSSPDILDYQENGAKNTDVTSSMKISTYWVQKLYS